MKGKTRAWPTDCCAGAAADQGAAAHQDDSGAKKDSDGNAEATAKLSAKISKLTRSLQQKPNDTKRLCKRASAKLEVARLLGSARDKGATPYRGASCSRGP